jgi:hypothetical protein
MIWPVTHPVTHSHANPIEPASSLQWKHTSLPFLISFLLISSSFFFFLFFVLLPLFYSIETERGWDGREWEWDWERDREIKREGETEIEGRSSMGRRWLELGRRLWNQEPRPVKPDPMVDRLATEEDSWPENSWPMCVKPEWPIEPVQPRPNQRWSGGLRCDFRWLFWWIC